MEDVKARLWLGFSPFVQLQRLRRAAAFTCFQFITVQRSKSVHNWSPETGLIKPDEEEY